MTRFSKVLLVKTLEAKLPFIKKTQNKSIKMLFVGLFSFLILPEFINSKKKWVFPYLELVITERCSLKCKDCANLMQYYKNPVHYSFDSILSDLQKLEKKTKSIGILQVLGGEPFVYPELSRLLAYISAKKLYRKIQVVTNGTVLPKKDVLSALKNKKITVIISDYGAIAKNQTSLIKALKENKIKYKLLAYSAWMDYGEVKAYDWSREELQRSYYECASAECKALQKGKIFTCQRAANLYNLGILTAENSYIDIEKDGLEKQKEFYNRKCDRACEMCVVPWQRKEVQPAVQMPEITNAM